MGKIFTFLFIFSLHYSFAQTYSIIGKVNDENNKAIELGNAILLSAKDSSIIKGDFFILGQFKINDVTETKLIIKLTAIGYDDSYHIITNTNNDSIVDVGIIQLKLNNTLKEIEVVSKTPMFETDGEKVVVNVEKSSLNSAGTALDVLKKSPAVMVNSNDAVSVFGKGTAIIYVDGQQIASSDILKTISSAEIKEIEIIKNPSAKYDAGGQAVINISTIKNNLEGYNGNIIQNTLYGRQLFTSQGIRFNYKQKKISSFASYFFTQGKNWSEDEYFRSIKNNDSSFTEMKNNIHSIYYQKGGHYYRAGANYSIDSVNTLGVQYNGFYSINKNTAENTNDVFLNSFPLFSMSTNTHSNPESMNNSANVNYTRKLDTLKSEFSIAFQYVNYSSKNIDLISQNIFDSTNTTQFKRSSGNNNIQLYTTQTDFIKAINKYWKLEVGAKDSYIANKSNISFDNYTSTGDWVTDSSYLNGYNFNENILAGYTQLRFSKNKLNLRTGIRTEHTNSSGFSIITNKQVIKRNYTNFFPNAFIGYDISKDLNANLTYSSRIARPTFQDMDPFINYIDSLSSFRGNPYLLPSYTHSIEASLIYLKEASITLGYTRVNGAMNLVVDKIDNVNSFTAITKNLDYSETYSIGLTIPYELSWWTTYNYFGYMQNTFSYKDNGSIINNKKPLFYMYLYDEFRIKKWFSTEITFEYTSSGVDGIFRFQPFYNLSANIKKTFLKDKLTCRLIVNDILFTSIQRASSNVTGFNVDYISKERTRYILLSLNYRFGKLKANDYRDKTVNQEEFNRIKQKK